MANAYASKILWTQVILPVNWWFMSVIMNSKQRNSVVPTLLKGLTRWTLSTKILALFLVNAAVLLYYTQYPSAMALLIGITLSLVFSAYIVVTVAVPLLHMQQVLSRMADGFSATLPKFSIRSETGQLFTAMSRIGYNLDAINKTQAVISFEMDGTIITANQPFLDTMGYTLEEIQGQHHSMFAPPGLAESPEYAEFWDILRSGKFHSGEFQRIGKNGDAVWIKASYNPILDINGKPIRVTKFAVDITDGVKKRHEVEMVSLVAEKSDNSVVITDAEERIEYVNTGFTKLTGYSMEECIGKRPGELLQGKDTDPEQRKIIRAKLDAREPFYDEILNYSKDGKPYWISMSINPVYDDNGELRRFISIQGDVTANKKIALDNEKGMQEAMAVLDGLSKGNLTKQMVGDYSGSFKEIKQAINQTIDKLVETTRQIADTCDTVNTSISEIADSSEDLAQRTESQAVTLQETSSAIEQLTQSVQANTTNAQDANSLSKKANDIANQGGDVVQGAVAAVKKIQESSQKIAGIISTIDDIAFQTNLLALNASVEAARAGSAGKGFAVVASEVRSLAGRSAEASKEIKKLINTSVDQVQTGADLVNESGESLGQIVESVRDVSNLIEAIAKASEEQAVRIKAVNKAVDEIDEATQHNAALSEESTAASRNMTEQSKELARLVGFFRAA